MHGLAGSRTSVALSRAKFGHQTQYSHGRATTLAPAGKHGPESSGRTYKSIVLKIILLRSTTAVLIRTAAPAPPPSALLSLLVLGAGQAATTWLLRKPRGLPKSKDNGRSSATGREDQAEAQPRDD